MRFDCNNLSCRRGDLRILSDVSFSIEAGRAIILRGPNGSGKTTLLRTLAGLSPSDGGNITGPEDDIIYAGHADGIKSQMTVAENLQFWADVFGQGSIDAALDCFDLRPLASRAAQHLSAGQKRRLGLSRLLVSGRAIWLLDEPTVSLDAGSVKTFARMIESHLSSGGIAILATHIDLGLNHANTLDISQFTAQQTDSSNPFLDEAFT
jgi:heme exporter protein A